MTADTGQGQQLSQSTLESVQEQLQQATFRTETEKTPLPRENPNKPRAATNDLRSRTKTANCAQHSFSCEWPRLSESISELKKALFGPPDAWEPILRRSWRKHRRVLE